MMVVFAIFAVIIVLLRAGIIALRSLPTNTNITNTSFFVLYVIITTSSTLHHVVRHVLFINREDHILFLMLRYTVGKSLPDKLILP